MTYTVNVGLKLRALVREHQVPPPVGQAATTNKPLVTTALKLIGELEAAFGEPETGDNAAGDDHHHAVI